VPDGIELKVRINEDILEKPLLLPALWRVLSLIDKLDGGDATVVTYGDVVSSSTKLISPEWSADKGPK
jgi:hypothetical protein